MKITIVTIFPQLIQVLSLINSVNISLSSTDGINNPLVTLNRQFESEVEWKKIYIELREVVSGSTSAQYFEFTLDALLPNGVNSGQINIDNFKAVYF